MTMTLGELISGLVEAYERRYEDHELATVKAALVIDDLLRARRRRGVRPARSDARHAA
jgi:hypothetical protein